MNTTLRIWTFFCCWISQAADLTFSLSIFFIVPFCLICGFLHPFFLCFFTPPSYHPQMKTKRYCWMFASNSIIFKCLENKTALWVPPKRFVFVFWLSSHIWLCFLFVFFCEERKNKIRKRFMCNNCMFNLQLTWRCPTSISPSNLVLFRFFFERKRNIVLNYNFFCFVDLGSCKRSPSLSLSDSLFSPRHIHTFNTSALKMIRVLIVKYIHLRFHLQ